MRTIKFKAKTLNTGEWIVGDLIHLVDGVYISNDNGNNMAHVNPDTVCQFTGFLDKNGKEIYEGDVLRSNTFPFSRTAANVYDNYYGVIGWSDEKALFYMVAAKNTKSSVKGVSDGIADFISQKMMHDFEVIGNVHEDERKQNRSIYMMQIEVSIACR